MEVLLEGGLAARSLGVPHVLHYRGNTMDRPRWVFDALVALWTATADQVFCISHATADLFLRRGRREKTEVMYNPVDARAFAPGPASETLRRELGATGGGPLIGTVGRIHPRKDLETFLRAAGLVRARMPDARFVVVGAAEVPVEQAYLARLQALTAELGLGDRMIFVGARRDVGEIMRALDLFVLTSRHEGFGRVVAEAMTAARPSVVTDEGAPPELVERGRYGLCARPADAEDFARCILELATNRPAADALGARAAEAACQFDAAVIGDRVWRCYERLLGRTSGVL
jgi:glycosyltransferase involved in cell wall biosynthesis